MSEAITLENGAFAARVSYQLTQDPLSNCSVVHITGLEMKANAVLGGCWITGSMTVNGKQAVELVLSNTESCGIVMIQSFQGGTEDTWTGFRSQDVVLEHLADGSCTMKLTVNLSVRLTGNGTNIDPGLHTSASQELPRIPRACQLAATPGALGESMTIRIARASESFRDTLRWRCGSHCGTIAEKTAQTQLQWTPPRTLADQAPNDLAAKIVITAESFSGSTAIGSTDLTVTCAIPEDMVPTASLTLSDRLDYPRQYGGYIQNQSQLRVQTQAAGVYGSTVAQILVTCGSLTGAGADTTFVPEKSGSLPIAVVVTDSRGRTCRVTAAVTVLPYEKPEISIREAYRCDAAGNAQNDGSWLKLVFDARVDGDRAAYHCLWAVHGSTGETRVELPDYGNQTTVRGGSVILAAGVDTGYDCRIGVTDRFQTVYTLPVWISVAFILLDLSRNTRAVGIGMRARSQDTLSIGMDADMTEHRLKNLLPPVEDGDAVTKAYLEARLAAFIG